MSRIELEGCFNFRDLGGVSAADGRRVATGRLYRADSVHLATRADVALITGDLAVRTLIDLRSEAEVEAAGSGAIDGTLRHHLPFGAAGVDSALQRFAGSADRSPDAMAARYALILESSGALVRQAVEALAAADALPAVFFCTAGKDRTGVLAAVVLGALGVSDEDVVADYVRTEAAIDRIIGRLAAAPGSPPMYRDHPPSHFAPHAETMRMVVDHVRAGHGSWIGYLRAHGTDAATVDRLREVLLEDAAGG